MKIYKGTYIEVTEPLAEFDGDYLRLSIKVRVVANGFDNIRKHSYPDDYGLFVQGMGEEEIHREFSSLCDIMRTELETIYKFSEQDIRKVVEFAPLKHKN